MWSGYTRQRKVSWMWKPTSEQEIVAAIEAGHLIENASFDAKAALPTQNRSKDLAKDVAAMATNGGILLYGVGEDEHGRPTVTQPFKLAGTRERVDQIVWSSISEPPIIEVHAIPTEDDPSLGYLVVVVPASPRAPHMVTADGDNRFYGRRATGNVLLSEGDVARLYERRHRWEADRSDMLDEAIESAPIPPREDFAYLHVVARPLVPDEELYARASKDQQATQFLGSLISAASSAKAVPNQYTPSFSGVHHYVPHADGWAAIWGPAGVRDEREDPAHVLDLEVGLNGNGRLFCGRAAQRHPRGFLIFEPLVADLTTKFLAVIGGLYSAGGYMGLVDVGVAVTGLRDGVSFVLRENVWIDSTPYNKDEYRRTERLPASHLVDDPRGAASKMVLPLLRATTRESYDPFSNWTR
jgi:hypothetical protein